ncbi:hypothetical protein C2S51_014308 [Perilla frutescens var. frutescens]|nr:hypothetical protein C2S51_014308 [Perilla frutescens var. frutescens]
MVEPIAVSTTIQVVAPTMIQVPVAVLDERRSNLTPDHLKAQMMLKDESKADLREQENRWDDLMDGPLIEVGSESKAEGGSQTGDDWDDDFEF